MKYLLSIKQIIAVLIAFSVELSNGHQPSYQVSIYVHLQAQKPPLHICNGAIVQSRLILTTASCLHYEMSPNNPAVLVNPGMISVIGGSSTKYRDELTLYVADIFLADKFNYTTGVNDLALLRLNGILPLDTRNDINWITLEDDKKYDGPCLANFFESNSPQGTPKYIQTEQMPILDSETCRVASVKFVTRKNDICSLYHIPTDLDCNSIAAIENYNDERGTGLVCGNKLVGLLSTILPGQNASDCKDGVLKAYYTTVVPYISWIFDIIMKEDLKMYNEGEYISSSPYAGESNSFIETQETETVTSTIHTTTVNFKTTLSPSQINGAITLEQIHHILFGILGIVYITAYLT